MKYSIPFALAAFALGVLAFFGFCVHSTDNGVLAIISICTTLIVGLAVVDSLRLRELEEQLMELKNAKEELFELKNQFTEIKQKANISLDANWGFTLYQTNPRNALRQIWKAIELSFSLKESPRIKTCLKILNIVVEKIEKDNDLKKELKNTCKGEMPIEITKVIRLSEDYADFQEKLDQIIKKIDVIVKKN